MLSLFSELEKNEELYTVPIRKETEEITNEVVYPLLTEEFSRVRESWKIWMDKAQEKITNVIVVYMESTNAEELASLQGKAQSIIRDLSASDKLSDDARHALTEAIGLMDNIDWAIFRLEMDSALPGKPSENIKEDYLYSILRHEVAYLICILAIKEALDENISIDRANFLAAWTIQFAQQAKALWNKIGGICPECGDPFIKERSNQRFCSTQHRKNYNTRKVRER